MIGFRFLLHRLKSDGLQTRQPVTYRVRKKAKKAGPIANFWPNLARCRALISTLQYLKGSNICFKKTVNHKSDIWNRISDPPTKKRKTMINTATEGENHKKREQIQRIKDSLKQFKKNRKTFWIARPNHTGTSRRTSLDTLYLFLFGFK